MESPELAHLKYPIGKRIYTGSLSTGELTVCFNDIESLPKRLRHEVEHLTPKQLNTPYRAGGWTVRQVVHHLSDSHMNAFMRCKLMLTENEPTIKPYVEAAWASTNDCILMPIEPGLDLLKALHCRWLVLLRSVTVDDLKKTYIHPQYGKIFTLREVISLYAWHSNHHLAHISALKERSRWT